MEVYYRASMDIKLRKLTPDNLTEIVNQTLEGAWIDYIIIHYSKEDDERAGDIEISVTIKKIEEPAEALQQIEQLRQKLGEYDIGVV